MSEFITGIDIKNNTSISNAVDSAKFLENYIGVASEMWVENILGTALAHQLHTAIDSAGSATGLTGSQKTLVINYIQPLHIWATFYEALPFMFVKVKGKGVVKEGENSVSLEEYGSMRTSVMDKLHFYTDRLQCYLEANTSTFTAYRSSTSTNNNTNGIYLGNY